MLHNLEVNIVKYHEIPLKYKILQNKFIATKVSTVISAVHAFIDFGLFLRQRRITSHDL